MNLFFPTHISHTLRSGIRQNFVLGQANPPKLWRVPLLTLAKFFDRRDCATTTVAKRLSFYLLTLATLAGATAAQSDEDELIKITKERLPMDPRAMTLCVGPQAMLGPHVAPEVDIFVNPAVIEYRRENPDAFDYPVGSKFVKKKYPSAGAKTPDIATIMVKKTNDGKVADWEFSMIRLSDGKALKPHGRVSCADCHQRYEERGFISAPSENAMQRFLRSEKAPANGAAEPNPGNRDQPRDVPAGRPNLVLIVADDMGYGDCSAYNPDSKVVTPNLDRLAREGVRFTDAHSAATTCTASRYGLLTGINPARRGVVNGLTALGPVIDREETTIAELLKSRGYLTFMVGKWHLGFELKPAEPKPVFDLTKPLTGGPLDHGFDSFFGLQKSLSAAPYFFIRDRAAEAAPTAMTRGTKSSAKTSGADPRTAYGPGEMSPGFVHEASNSRLSDEVIAILEERAAAGDSAEPFLLYYAMLQPHTPWLPTEPFRGKSAAGPYGDYLVQMDHEVGRVLTALDRTELEQNTLVIFSSDNGSLWPAADIERWGHRANGPLSGGKARPQEGGHRVPFIARWPGRIPSGATSDALINHTDLLATLAELLGVDLDAATAGFPSIDSHSFLHVLVDPDAAHQRPAMAVTARSFRDGDWKLTFTRGARSQGPDGAEADDAGLFYLPDDLGESTDLSRAEPERKARLFAAYHAYFADPPLKLFAIQHRAIKDGQRAPAAAERPSPLPDSSADERKTEYQRRRAENLEKQAALLTEAQKESSAAARKQALAEGKKGVALRKATDAGANLTGEQRKQLEELREEMRQLTRDYRARLQHESTE